METGVHGVNLDSALAHVVAEFSFAHATVTIQGIELQPSCNDTLVENRGLIIQGLILH